jgi:phospholipid/cholesterol/gamma-HCH transport system substrate-binding protein
MENKISYIMIGAFVFVLFGASIFFILWLGKYAQNEAFSFYNVVTKESVSGLNEKAPVKLRGVSVGEVRDISINANNSEEVIVLIRVKEGTPIKEDTYATLRPQGITGLNFIELQGGSNEAKRLKTSSDKNAYGVIYSQPSMFSQLDTTLDMIGDKTENVLDRTNKIMSDKNIKNIEKILQNLEQTTQKLNDTLDEFSSNAQDVKSIFAKAKVLEDAVVDAAGEVALMAKYVSSAVNKTGIDAMNSVREAAYSVSKVMSSLEQKVQKGSFDVDILLKENLVPLHGAMDELRLFLLEARESLGKFSDSPSDILYKQTNITPAPNEEKK